MFMDESGHDHRSMPYEVRGGIALHASRVWSFVQQVQALEQEAFGGSLQEFGTEIKGSKLLDKDRFRWAAQETEAMPDIARRVLARAFLTKKQTNGTPNRNEFTAYGQARTSSQLTVKPVFCWRGTFFGFWKISRQFCLPAQFHALQQNLQHRTTQKTCGKTSCFCWNGMLIFWKNNRKRDC